MYHWEKLSSLIFVQQFQQIFRSLNRWLREFPYKALDFGLLRISHSGFCLAHPPIFQSTMIVFISFIHFSILPRNKTHFPHFALNTPLSDITFSFHLQFHFTTAHFLFLNCDANYWIWHKSIVSFYWSWKLFQTKVNNPPNLILEINLQRHFIIFNFLNLP